MLGCSVVFADPKSGREGGTDDALLAPPVVTARRTASGGATVDSSAMPRAPDLTTY